MKRKVVGVLLSGCGYLDGSEIQEAVFTILGLDELGVEVVCIAPRVRLKQVVDHERQVPQVGETRDVLVEAARIARGRIKDLAGVRATDLDALVVPGGFGAAKILSDFAYKGAEATPHPDVARLLRELHAAGKPIGALCIAPTLVAATLGLTAHPTLTIGEDEATAQAIEKLGARHRACPVDRCVVDREQRIVTAPAYMYDARPKDVFAGVRALCAEVVAMCDGGAA